MTEESSTETAEKTREPRDVLRDNMLFYDELAEELCRRIIELLKEQGAPAHTLAMMYKKMDECKDTAIDCATKLAPYSHPKLESIEMKKSVTHRFVVRAPKIISNSQEWIKDITPEMEESNLNMQRSLEKLKESAIDHEA